MATEGKEELSAAGAAMAEDEDAADKEVTEEVPDEDVDMKEG